MILTRICVRTEEEDLNSPSTSSLAMISAVSTATAVVSGAAAMTSPTAAVTVDLPTGSAVAAIPVDFDQKWHHMTEIVQQRPTFTITFPEAVDWLRRDRAPPWILEYMTTHRGSSSHPLDTAPFYEQINSKPQVDFNKNQLVEKLRRLKKKIPNAMSKINSGKEVFFKNPHDQAAFEISRKIWNHTGKIIGFEDNNVLDFKETDNHHLHHHVNNTNGNSTLNTPSANLNMEIGSFENGIEKKATMSNSNGSRKRSRSRTGKMEEDKPITPFDGNVANAASNINLNEKNLAGCDGQNLTGLIEETVRSCVSPMVEEMMSRTMAMMMARMGMGSRGAHGLGTLSLSPITMPHQLNMGIGSGGGGEAMVDERWRKQHILELRVHLRRLELVQEHIRAAMHELRRTVPNGEVICFIKSQPWGFQWSCFSLFIVFIFKYLWAFPLLLFCQQGYERRKFVFNNLY